MHPAAPATDQADTSTRQPYLRSCLDSLHASTWILFDAFKFTVKSHIIKLTLYLLTVHLVLASAVLLNRRKTGDHRLRNASDVTASMCHVI